MTVSDLYIVLMELMAEGKGSLKVMVKIPSDEYEMGCHELRPDDITGDKYHLFLTRE